MLYSTGISIEQNEVFSPAGIQAENQEERIRLVKKVNI